MVTNPSDVDLRVQLGRLRLPNPILVASGTFGYAREMEQVVDLARLGGILPKTITAEPRIGNRPWRTVETSAGLLNSIGLDNDGIDTFVAEHLPYLATVGAPIIVSIAGRNIEQYVALARQLDEATGVAAVELNISCPNVSGGVDYGTDPQLCGQLVGQVRSACQLPLLAKLTPNVTDIRVMAKAAAENGADALCLINTVLGMAVDWRQRRPLLGNVVGGLSGPAIKPIALRCIHQVAQVTDVPLIGIGGIGNLDDVMEFLVAGASAVQVGTANYYDPTITMRLLDELPKAMQTAGVSCLDQLIGTLQLPDASQACAPAEPSTPDPEDHSTASPS